MDDKKLIRKYYADRCLREAGISEDDLLCDSSGKIFYSRTFDSVWYQSHEDGEVVDVQVTVDATRRDLLEGFSLLIADFGYEETWQLENGKEVTIPVSGCELDLRVRDTQTHFLPVYVLESYVLDSTASSPVYGELRTQCQHAMKIWDQADPKTMDIEVDFGTVVQELARGYWEDIRAVKRLSLLHELADFCMEWGAEFYVPNLYPSNFRVGVHGVIVPYNAIMSVPLYAIKGGHVLYNQQRER